MSGFNPEIDDPWSYQSALLIGESQQLSELGVKLLEYGAVVQQQFLDQASDTYHLALEEFTIVVILAETDREKRLAHEISSILRRTDLSILVAFASRYIPLQVVSGGRVNEAWDVLLPLDQEKNNLAVLVDIIEN